MPQPGNIANIVPPATQYDALLRRVRELEKEVAAQRTARTGEAMMIGKGGITVQGGSITLKAPDGTVLQVMDAAGVTIDGDLILNGTETVSGDVVAANYSAGTSGFKLAGASGNAEFNEVALRDGIIGDDALTNPVRTDYYYDQANGYALSTGGYSGTATARATVTITIPAGFTAVTVFATVQDSGRNSSGSTDSIASCINIGSPGTDYLFSPGGDVEAGQGAVAMAILMNSLTGLNGGDTVSIQSRPSSQGFNWAADAYNTTVLSVLAIFFR